MSQDVKFFRELRHDTAEIQNIEYDSQSDVLTLEGDEIGECFNNDQKVTWFNTNSGQEVTEELATKLEIKHQIESAGEILSEQVFAIFDEVTNYVPEYAESYLDDRDGARIEIISEYDNMVQETFYSVDSLISHLSARLSDSMRHILQLQSSLFDLKG